MIQRVTRMDGSTDEKRRRALTLLRQYLQERVNFDTFKDAMYRIGILARNSLGFL